MTDPVKNTKVLARMDRTTYEQFEKQCEPPLVNKDMSPCEVAYRLGIQAVLKKLREGFVVGA
jgi:hypothetical protein